MYSSAFRNNAAVSLLVHKLGALIQYKWCPYNKRKGYRDTHTHMYTFARVSPGHTPRSGIAEPQSIHIFNFVRRRQLPCQVLSHFVLPPPSMSSHYSISPILGAVKCFHSCQSDGIKIISLSLQFTYIHFPDD